MNSSILTNPQNKKPSEDARTLNFVNEVLSTLCEFCDVSQSDTIDILNTKCMTIDGKNLVVSPTELPGCVDLILEIGTPAPNDREKVFATLLGTSFEQLTPGVIFSLSSRTGQLFASMPLNDQMGQHAQHVLNYLATHILDFVNLLHQTYSFMPRTQHHS